MGTLQEIYGSHSNGQRKQFVEQVEDYGPYAFFTDVQEEVKEGVLPEKEALGMLTTFIKLREE